MKSRKILLVITLGLGILLFLGTCASEKTPLTTDNIDELVGIWINAGYSELPQRVAIEPDGVYVTYRKIEDTIRRGTGTLVLVEKWADSKQNIFCKIQNNKGEMVYELVKIGDSGNVLEYVQSYKDYPLEINPNDLSYHSKR